MLQPAWFSAFGVQRTLYYDQAFYYAILFCSTIDGTCFKLSVRRRFVNLILHGSCFLTYYPLDGYIFSFRTALIYIQLSLLFTFKRRLKFHGLAFNSDYDTATRELFLNIGYTRTPVIQVAPYIEAVKQNRRNRRKLLFESFLLELISDLVFTIRNLRPIRVYYNPAKRGGRRGIRVYMKVVRRKKFKKDAHFR